MTENNKVFEMETLSTDTFLVPSLQGASNASYNQEVPLTGKVTCSVPFCELLFRGYIVMCIDGDHFSDCGRDAVGGCWVFGGRMDWIEA